MLARARGLPGCSSLGQTVIRKEPLGADAEIRVRHEVAVLERLRGLEGVAQLAGAPRFPGSIVLADAGGASLAGVAKPLAAGELACSWPWPGSWLRCRSCSRSRPSSTCR